MELTLLKPIAALIILIIAAVAGLFPFRRKLKSVVGYDFPRGEALASGVFLGAGLIHMLGDANHEFNQIGIHYPLAFLLCGLSFLALLLLEHLGTEISEHEGKNTVSVAIISFTMLSIHSIVEGAALGISIGLSTTLLILFAIVAHKWAASFSLAVQLNKSPLPIRSSALLFALFALMTPIGIFLGDLIILSYQKNNLITPLFNAIAAGTFLYIGTLHGLKRSVMVERCCNLNDFLFVIIGFSLMAVVAIYT